MSLNPSAHPPHTGCAEYDSWKCGRLHIHSAVNREIKLCYGVPLVPRMPVSARQMQNLLWDLTLAFRIDLPMQSDLQQLELPAPERANDGHMRPSAQRQLDALSQDRMLSLIHI